MYTVVALIASRQVFGVPLAEMMRRNRDPGEEVPWVLKRFVRFLSKFGLEVKKVLQCSVYRKRKSSSRTRHVQAGLETSRVDITVFRWKTFNRIDRHTRTHDGCY